MSRIDSITTYVNDFNLVSQLSYNKNKMNNGKIILTCDNDRCRFYLSIWLDERYIKIFYSVFTSKNTFMLYIDNVCNNKSFDNMKDYIFYEMNKLDNKLFVNVPKKLFMDYINAWFDPSLINNVFL